MSIRTKFLIGASLVSAVAVAANAAARRDQAPHRVITRRATYLAAPPQAAPPSAARLGVQPLYQQVSNPRVESYATQSDYPDYQRGFDGKGVAIPADGYAARSNWAIGVQSGYMGGGGCVLANVNDPNSGCASPFTYVERERWTFRMSFLDPTTDNEINIGFGDAYGFTGDDVLEWVRHTAGNHSCFTFYPCDYYGLDLNEIYGSVRAFAPTCTNKVGPGYRAVIYYQYSRYRDSSSVPPGATEWEPATVPATTNRLDKPGAVTWSSDWRLGVGEYALVLSVPGVVHPEVESGTGYVTAAPTIAPGTGTVTVTSYDCGVLPNIPFTITREYTEASAGHTHGGTPPLDSVSSLVAYSGTTDANGKFTTTLTTGRIAGLMTYTLKSDNVLGQKFTARPSNVSTGFVGLVDPGAGGGAPIRYTGSIPAHPANHYASPELHAMVRDMATRYNNEADAADQGSVGLNDMSLELGGLFDISGNWSPSHFRHRFGTDCDIDQNVLDPSGTFTPLDQDTLQAVVEMELDGIFVKESKNRMHVQVPEYQVGDILLREAR